MHPPAPSSKDQHLLWADAGETEVDLKFQQLVGLGALSRSSGHLSNQRRGQACHEKTVGLMTRLPFDQDGSSRQESSHCLTQRQSRECVGRSGLRPGAAVYRLL